MKLNRWIVLPAAGLAALIIGVAAVEAAPSPSASPTTSKNYAQTFIDKLAGILHLTPTQTTDALKQAQLQTVDQMLKDGQITQQQADAMKARINAGQGLGAVGGFGRHGGGFGGFGGFKGNGALMQSLTTAELNAAASALHMSSANLQSALRSGKSLTDLETQQKVSDSAVKTAMQNAAKGVLDNAVKAGTITQAQADSILSRVGSGLKFRSYKQDSESNEAPGTPGGQAPSTPAPTTPTPNPSQSPAAYYSTI
jgi:ABC-type transport system involved in cytochrome bd biosynthesis fused ATPase/permease subunit